jgi:hypothetical protein
MRAHDSACVSALDALHRLVRDRAAEGGQAEELAREEGLVLHGVGDGDLDQVVGLPNRRRTATTSSKATMASKSSTVWRSVALMSTATITSKARPVRSGFSTAR